MITLQAVIEQLHQQFDDADLFYGHGTDNAWDEAVALALTITRLPDDQQSMLVEVSQPQQELINSIAKQRIGSKKPLAYLLGECQYMGVRFLIEEGVIVPRSPLGYLIGGGLEPWLPEEVGSVLDLCSGSGCLGILAALKYPRAKVTLVEQNPQALRLSQRNISLHGLDKQVQAVAGNVLETLSLDTTYDLILCNPPYVNAEDMQSLPAEYKHEPVAALAAGVDGLDVVDGVMAQLPNLLSPHGLFVLEVGESETTFKQKYAHLPLIWPELDAGGEGIFLLEAQHLSSHTSPSF